MAEAAFLEPNRLRPGAALTVVLMHGAALAALLLSRSEFVEPERYTPIDVIDVAAPPPPPPPPAETPPVRREIVEARLPPVPAERGIAIAEAPLPDPPALASRSDGAETGAGAPAGEEAAARPAPVRVAAQMIAGNLQPPYPVSEQRMEREGRVVIQITIGPDGRIVAARRVSATSDAFWQATERHARRNWRFRPATVDGRPVESTRTLTVHFQLDN